MLRHLVPLALAALLGSGSTCSSETQGSQGGGDTRTAKLPQDEGKCVDSWLEEHHLDQYGNPPGTMYAGGTPLFDETTGKSTDRLEYIYQHHADAKAACHK